STRAPAPRRRPSSFSRPRSTSPPGAARCGRRTRLRYRRRSQPEIVAEHVAQLLTRSTHRFGGSGRDDGEIPRSGELEPAEPVARQAHGSPGGQHTESEEDGDGAGDIDPGQVPGPEGGDKTVAADAGGAP